MKDIDLKIHCFIQFMWWKGRVHGMLGSSRRWVMNHRWYHRGLGCQAEDFWLSLETIFPGSFFFINSFLLEYICITVLCQFLPFSKINQLYVCIQPLFFGFLSHLVHHRLLNRVPSVLLFIYFIHSINCVCISIPISQFVFPHPPWYPYICSLCPRLYFCLQIILFIPFFFSEAPW